MRRNAKSSYKYKYNKYDLRNKMALLKFLEKVGPRLKNKLPVVKQIRAFQARKHAFKRKVVGNLARAATLGYVKPLSHKSLKPCKGLRKQIRRAYFGFKNVRNWKRGGNRTKDKRSQKVAKSRFTVLNCK